MKAIILLLLCCVIFSSEATPQDDFWSRVNVGILGGPLFPGGDDADFYDLSTGYYIGIDARYQLFRFMAVGFSIGRNAWSGSANYAFKTTQVGEGSVDISSGKTNVCLSLHFGPSAPTWANITSSRGTDIHDVQPYQPGMFVPFFIFEIGPYFWDWTEESNLGTYEESGSDVFIRGTLAGFYQMSHMISFTIGLAYTMYEFGTDFTSIGLFGGIRFNVGEIIKE